MSGCERCAGASDVEVLLSSHEDFVANSSPKGSSSAVPMVKGSGDGDEGEIGDVGEADVCRCVLCSSSSRFAMAACAMDDAPVAAAAAVGNVGEGGFVRLMREREVVVVVG